MNKKILKLLYCFAFISALVVTINSCKKKEPDTETTSATDNSIAEGEFSRFAMNTNSIAVGDSGVQKGIYLPIPNSACPDHWWDPGDTLNGFHSTMWITYGTDNDGDGIMDVGCVDNDGKTRKGTIKAVFNSLWYKFPATVVMYLDSMGGYSVNGIKYGGKITITKNSPTSFTQKVTNGIASTSDYTIKWNCDRTITVHIGDVANPNDDFSLVSGTADGTDRNGKNFSVTINTPLRREMGCRWITSGNMTLKIDGKKDRTIDFGDGTCDDRATLTIDGNAFEFTLQ